MRLLVSWRALAAIAVVATVLAIVGVTALHRQITRRAVASAVVGARSIESLVVSRNLTLQDIWLTIDQRDEDAMDGDLTLLRSRGDLLGLRVWALVDGHLVYGDLDHRGTRASLPGPVRDRAGAGLASTSDVRDDPTGAPALAIYLPNDANGDGVSDAVTEILVPRTHLDDTVTDTTSWLYGGAGGFLAAVFVVLFMIRRHQLRQDYAATHDSLTGLGNRAMLYRLIRADTPAALFMIDLDGFKGINDTLGHQAGDELLVIVSSRLEELGRTSGFGTVVRLGGDEFAVLLSKPADEPAGLALAQETRAVIRRPMTVSGVPVEVDASIGIAFNTAPARDLGELMRCADVAMYDAKQHGTGVVVYSPSAERHADQNITLVPELRRALSLGELELHYQPVHGAGRPVREVEALLRWRHPTRGLLPADDFVPHASKTSLMRELTTWVLHTAAAQAAQWRAIGRPLRVAVHVATLDLLDEELLGRVVEATTAAGLPLDELELLVSESDLLADTEGAVLAAIETLTGGGVSIVINDFGLNDSALRMFGRLSIRQVKVHPSYVRALSRLPVAARILHNLVDVPRQLAIQCVAKGVETDADLRQLDELGLDTVQGNVITPPLPADEVVAWIEQWDRVPLKHARAQ